jgi:hypothetical protein
MDYSQLAAGHRSSVAPEAGALYPLVAYGGIEDAAAHEDADDTLAEHGEELDEVIFSGMVALR